MPVFVQRNCPRSACGRVRQVPVLEPALLGFVLIVFAAYAVQTATGFGSNVVCLTLGAQLLGLETVIRLVVPLSFLQLTYIVVRHHDGILWPLLLKRILPLMLTGMGLAFVFLGGVKSAWLGLAFGLMVLVLSVRELYRLRSAGSNALEPMPKAKSAAALTGAGIIHGVYAAGGPLLVYALGREDIDKKSFRSTLAVVWMVLNAVLLAKFLMAGDYNESLARTLLVLVPAVPFGIVAGEWIHHKVDEHRFKTLVFALLLVAAISLVVRYGLRLV